MRTEKKLGIIGGMGAAATCNWYRMLIEILANKYHLVQDEEYPEIYIFSLSMKGWSERGIENEELVKAELLIAVKKMESLKVDYLIIACNTAHIFYEYLQSGTKIKIISLISSCVDFIKENGFSTVGILSSETTRKYSLYKNKFEKKGINVIELDLLKEQPDIDKVILSVQGNNQGTTEKRIMKHYINRLASEGAECVILGCTELPLAIKQADTEITLFDAGYILLDKVTHLLYDRIPEHNGKNDFFTGTTLHNYWRLD